MTFVFYDTETTGVNPAFDQVLQLAAVRTDENLNVTDKFEIRSRLLPYVVPSPEALLTTGMAVNEIAECPTSHFEMARQIFFKFREWSREGATFLGWNSIRFDELMLRQTYYKTLHPIYQTQWAGNGRGDLMRMAQAIWAMEPDSIRLAKSDDGSSSFKLEDVARANFASQSHVHDAMSDTMATLGIARAILLKSPTFWWAAIANCRKAVVSDMLNGQALLLFAEVRGGVPKVSVVCPISANTLDPNEWAVFDVKFDPIVHFKQPDARLFGKNEEGDSPIRRIRINTQPMLFALESWLTGSRPHLSEKDQHSRAVLIGQNPEFRVRVSRLLAQTRAERRGAQNVEEQIYDGFAAAEDQALLGLFQRSSWEKRAQLIGKFEDSRYRQLGQRLLAVERPDLLSASQASRFKAWMKSRLFALDDVPWLTVPQAFRKIEDLRAIANASQQVQLDRLELHLQTMGRVNDM